MATTTRRTLDKSLMTFDIPAEIEKLKQGAQWKTSHRGAVTLAKNPHLRIVLVVLSKGVRIHEHHAEGPITVSVVEGSILFRATEHENSLSSGGLLTLAGGIPHEVEAVEESAFVITVVQPPAAN